MTYLQYVFYSYVWKLYAKLLECALNHPNIQHVLFRTGPHKNASSKHLSGICEAAPAPPPNLTCIRIMTHLCSLALDAPVPPRSAEVVNYWINVALPRRLIGRIYMSIPMIGQNPENINFPSLLLHATWQDLDVCKIPPRGLGPVRPHFSEGWFATREYIYAICVSDTVSVFLNLLLCLCLRQRSTTKWQ